MWYWFYEIASVTLVIGLVALILWWAWRQETAGRFADTLDRRFAKYKTEPKPVTVARRLAHHWQMLETLSGLSEIQTEQRKKLEQRVTALEEDNRWHRTAAELLMNLEPRLAEVENVMNQIHKLEPPLPLAAIPSQVTDASITGANWDVAEQESIPPESLASSRSDQRIIVGGRVGRALKSADPSDAST